MLVGGYSVILHGYSRTTGDLDIWVERTAANYARLVRAFQVFGLPVFDMSAENFLSRPDLDVFTFGRPPVAIDIITQLKGLDFPEAYAQAPEMEVNGLLVRLLHLQICGAASAPLVGPATRTTSTTCPSGPEPAARHQGSRSQQGVAGVVHKEARAAALAASVRLLARAGKAAGEARKPRPKRGPNEVS
jgi:hypothetical protein